MHWNVGALAVGWLQLRGAFLVLYVDAAVSLPFPLRADTTGAVGCELVAVCVDTHLSLYKDCMNIRICMCEGITYIGLLMRLGVHTYTVYIYVHTYLVDVQKFVCKGKNGLLHICVHSACSVEGLDEWRV